MPIDRRGLDAHDDLVGCWFRNCDFHQRQFKFAALLDQSAKLKSGFAFETHLKASAFRVVSAECPL
jgi:hypothetical protein